MITVLKFSDGSDLSLSDLQIKELRTYFKIKSCTSKSLTHNQIMDKVCVLINNGINTEGKVLARFKGNEDRVIVAIDDLVSSGIIVKEGYEHKYSKNTIHRYLLNNP